MRITYGVTSIEKSLGISINYENWDSDIKQVTEMPMHDHQLKQKAEEYIQKIMEAFYMLTNHRGEFTLREIMDIAFTANQEHHYSLVGVFDNGILKLEKQLNPGNSNRPILESAEPVFNTLKTTLK